MDISKYIDEHLDEIIANPDFLLETGVNTLKLLKENKSEKFVNSNELDYLEQINEPNEDNYQDDIESELFENLYEKKLQNLITNNNIDLNENKNKNEGEDEDEDEDKDEDEDEDSNLNSDIEIEYYIDLLNIFVKYYNEKFEKNDNFFTGIKNTNSDTSNCMELFFESIFEFDQFKKQLLSENNLELEDEKINNFLMNFIFEESESEKISKLFETWDKQIYCLSWSNKKFFSPSLLICLNFINKNNIILDSWNIFNLRDN